MKTTVDIPDDLYGQARRAAAARGLQVAALITEGLEKLLGPEQPRQTTGAGKNGKPHPTDLPPGAARWLAGWRSLGRRQPATKKPGLSAAEAVTRLRR